MGLMRTSRSLRPKSSVCSACDHGAPRRGLLAEGDAVLQVHDDAVGAQADGLLDLAQRVAGHEEHSATEMWGMIHELVLAGCVGRNM
jgi:hypothetical protein